MDLMSSIDAKLQAREIAWGPEKRWWIARTNLLDSVNYDIVLPDQVRVVDATLREGEEVPDTLLSEDQKVKLAHRIQEAGFAELEVGYAGVIQEHFDLVQRLRREGFEGAISSHTRIYGRHGEWKNEIDRNLDAGAQVLTMVGSATEVGTATTPWLPKDKVADRIADCVSYAKSKGATVTFGLADIIRTSFDQIVACYRAAADAGVDRAYVYDGHGAARPGAIRFLTRFIKDLVGADIDIGVHAHDTYGLAQANAVAALTSGANTVDAVPLGLGEGGGITATEEISAAMEILYGVPTGVRLDKLRLLCSAVARAFEIAVPKTKAVVGANTYSHQIDSHVAAILRGAWYSWEVARPEVLGHERNLAFAHAKIRDGRSGAVAALLESMGIDVTDDELRAVIEELRLETERRRSLSVDEAKDLVRRVLGINTEQEE